MRVVVPHWSLLRWLPFNLSSTLNFHGTLGYGLHFFLISLAFFHFFNLLCRVHPGSWRECRSIRILIGADEVLRQRIRSIRYVVLLLWSIDLVLILLFNITLFTFVHDLTFIWFWVKSWWMLERVWLNLWFSKWIYSLRIQTEITKLSSEYLTSSLWDWASLRLSSVEVCKTFIGGDAAILVWIQIQRRALQVVDIESSFISHSSLRLLRNRLYQGLSWVCIEWIMWISLWVSRLLLLVRR